MDPNTEAARLVAQLETSDRETYWRAFATLNAMGDDAVPAVMAGLSHPDWRVRRGCALFADRNPHPALLERLKLTLHDPKARVRMIAVHSMSCEHCKPGGNPVDAIPLIIDRLKNDRAIRVRRMAAAGLIAFADEPRAARALRKALAVETDERLRRMAKWGLRSPERSRVAPGTAATA